MIKYLITFLWNSRRKFFGIVIEQALVFIVLTFCIVSLFDAIRQYREPGLLDIDDVALCGFMAAQPLSPQDWDKCREINKAINACIENIRQWDDVESISESVAFVPYLRPPEFYIKDSVTVSGHKYQVQAKYTDAEARNVFKIKMEQGEWFPPLPNGAQPVVITRQFADQLGADYNLIGTQLWDSSNRPYTITGIVSGIKTAAFEASVPGVIFSWDGSKRLATYYREICARIKPGKLQEFCIDCYHEYQRIVPYANEIEFTIRDLNVFKGQDMFPIIFRLKLLVIPTCFLLVFAFIGTLGLLMLHVKKRAQEFGIHRTVGATRKQLQWWMVVQSLFLTLIAAIPGIILSLFIFNMTAANLLSILISLGAMLVFSFISAYYPAWQITKINPAVVLHQD